MREYLIIIAYLIVYPIMGAPPEGSPTHSATQKTRPIFNEKYVEGTLVIGKVAGIPTLFLKMGDSSGIETKIEIDSTDKTTKTWKEITNLEINKEYTFEGVKQGGKFLASNYFPGLKSEAERKLALAKGSLDIDSSLPIDGIIFEEHLFRIHNGTLFVYECYKTGKLLTQIGQCKLVGSFPNAEKIKKEIKEGLDKTKKQNRERYEVLIQASRNKAAVLSTELKTNTNNEAEFQKRLQVAKTRGSGVQTITALEEALKSVHENIGRVTPLLNTEKNALIENIKITMRIDNEFKINVEDPIEHFWTDLSHPDSLLSYNKSNFAKMLFEKFVKPIDKDFDFVEVKPGTFKMGSPSTEAGRNTAENEDQHQVPITEPYEIQSREVTQRLWQKIMGNNPSMFKDPNKPVESVSFREVQDFLKKLNIERTEAGDRYTYSLPTEAEWEYAARGGNMIPNEQMNTAYSFGNNVEELNDFGVYKGNSDMESKVVASKKPNPLGLFDMHGNVWEWVLDSYQSDTPSLPIDPVIDIAGSDCIARGGSWSRDANFLRSASRIRTAPNVGYPNVGFRVVKKKKKA